MENWPDKEDFLPQLYLLPRNLVPSTSRYTQQLISGLKGHTGAGLVPRGLESLMRRLRLWQIHWPQLGLSDFIHMDPVPVGMTQRLRPLSRALAGGAPVWLGIFREDRQVLSSINQVNQATALPDLRSQCHLCSLLVDTLKSPSKVRLLFRGTVYRPCSYKRTRGEILP